MKLKAIETILKSAKSLIIYRDDRHGQWLGDGCSMYPIHNLPTLTDKHIFAMFDIPEDKQSKYLFRERGFPKGLDFRDYVDGDRERLIQRGKLTINALGRELEPLNTSVGTVFINTKYLKPFADEDDGYELYERRGSNGEVYIVAKSGMLLIGVISPFNIAGEKFLSELESLTEGVRLSLRNQKESNTQMTMEGAE